VGGLQDLLGGEPDEPRLLSRTRFDSVDAQIRDASGVSTPVAVAQLLRALADLLDGSGQCSEKD
jgi:hypothetical protein